jgi:hypothetical protein
VWIKGLKQQPPGKEPPENPKHQVLQVHLEEYRNLQIEGIERTKLQYLVIGSNFALVSLALALLRALPSYAERSILLLLLPLLSVIAGFLYLDQGEKILAKDAYIDSVLRLRMLEAIEWQSGVEPKILGLHEWRKNLNPRAVRIFRIFTVVRLGVVITPGVLVLIGLISAWITLSSVRHLASWIDYFLFCIDVLAFLFLASTAFRLQQSHYLGMSSS